MSSGFEAGDELFWGTNGAVEAYPGALSTLAEARLGADDPLARFLCAERDGFYGGRIVVLDPRLSDVAGRDLVVELLDAATERLLGEAVFTEYGRKWVSITIAALRAKVAASDGARSDRRLNNDPSDVNT